MDAASRGPYALKPSPYSSHSLLLSLMPERGEGRRVLDLGCSDGYLSRVLSSRGYRVTGVERAGGTTSEFPREVELVEADLDHGLPPLKGQFEFVLCADILEHLMDPRRLLEKARNVLSLDGMLLASLPNSGNLYFRLNILMGRFPQDERGLFDRTHLHFYMWDNWTGLFRSAGFRITRCRPSGIPVGLAFPSRQHSLSIRAAERLSYELARFWKTMFAYQFIVAARPEGRE